jgi:hypothetical protein
MCLSLLHHDTTLAVAIAATLHQWRPGLYLAIETMVAAGLSRVDILLAVENQAPNGTATWYAAAATTDYLLSQRRHDS